MPLSDLHQQRKKGNLTILAIVMAFIALIWIVTMIKIAAL